MPTDLEIKNEILSSLDPNFIQKCEPEIDEWIRAENLDGKSVIQKFYSQWKSGKKGHKNVHNSWTGYCLGLTSQIPIDGKEFFIARRAFARPSPPDIDTDFDYERRSEVLDYLISRYGRYNVGNIGTYGALKMRSALTRIIKALDLANAWKLLPDGKIDPAYKTNNVEKVTEILSKLPPQRGAFLKVNDDETGEEIPLKTTRDVVTANSRACDDFRFYIKKYPELLSYADQIEGLLSIYSCHASGVVISDVPLYEIAPLRTAKDTDDTVSLATQFAYEDLESLGLIKFDLLGISTLTVISKTISLIEENTGIKLDVENLPIDPKQSMEARKTYDLYKSGKLIGVFQCESDGMQKTCVDLNVDTFEDIAAVISLYRPGPMDNIPDYADRKSGRKSINYFHPTIEKYVKDILSYTYGIAVYQEQLMFICNVLGRMSLGDGYVFIKGVGKKKLDIVSKNKDKFIDGCVENGVPRNIAEQYWDRFMVPFANYGFNKAHAAAYAYTSYITAFLKANFPEEFFVSYMNVETKRKKWDRVKELECEASRMGITILPRDINKCEKEWKIVTKKNEANGVYKSEIKPALNCKGFVSSCVDEIILNRPYKSVVELAEKTNIDIESLDALCDAKFFKTRKDKLKQEFLMAREDLKSRRQRGRGDSSQNLFDED